ncbi:MAG: molybdopterin-dependent oxidoreductase, partial [Alphaproteobacteria bacterium]
MASTEKSEKKIGSKIIVIDPVRTATAKLSDLWLQPKPGTDSALAMAIINWLITNQRYDKKFVESWTFGFDSLAKRAAIYPIQRVSEITGVSEDDIRKAAELYANGPSCFVSGHGIDAFTSGVQTFRAFHCLVAISGNLDRPGGNRRVKKPGGFTNYIE